MIKSTTQQEEITILNLKIPNSIASKYIRQKVRDLRGETDKYLIRVGNFNILLSVINRTTK